MHHRLVTPALALSIAAALFATALTLRMLADSPPATPAVSPIARPAPTIVASPPTLAAEQAWSLSDIVIDRPGRASRLADGIVIDYVLRGSATASAGTDVKEGSFQISISAFQPSRDLPGQPAGRWYIRGDWSITDAQAPPPAPGQRHRRGVLAGTLVSTMDADPLATAQDVVLPLQLPMTLTESSWVRGKGTLSLADSQERGSITLVVSRRPAIVQPPGSEP